MTLILTRQQAIAVMRRPSDAGATGPRPARLEPRLTSDGRYALPESVLTDPAHAEFADVLAAATADTVTAWSEYSEPYLLVDGKPMFVNGAAQEYTLSEPVANVFRFEIRANDPGTLTDLGLGNRRCELVSLKGDGYSSGQTLWMSWTNIVGSQHTGMLATEPPDAFCYAMQVHAPASKPPIVCANFGQGKVRIMTASDSPTDGIGALIVRTTTPFPDTGSPLRVVVAATLGAAGHLSVWIDGEQAYNADIPIGYWTDGGILGYPQWGVYEKNRNTREVMYTANIEWGTDPLVDRITAPLPVPDLSPWS